MKPARRQEIRQFVETHFSRFAEEKGNLKGIISYISTPERVFLDLHRQFDEGRLICLTGKKDGTNRPVRRLSDLTIQSAEDGREVWPSETLIKLAKSCTPFSKSGSAFLEAFTNRKDLSSLFQENSEGKFQGIKGLSVKKLGQQPSVKSMTCQNPECKAPEVILKCGGCKLVGYCNTECQTSDWKVHKTRCFILQALEKATNRKPGKKGKKAQRKT